MIVGAIKMFGILYKFQSIYERTDERKKKSDNREIHVVERRLPSTNQEWKRETRKREEGKKRPALDAFLTKRLLHVRTGDDHPSAPWGGTLGGGCRGHTRGLLRLFKDIQPVQFTTIHQPRLERPSPSPIDVHVHARHRHRRRRRRRARCRRRG
jgi:hypothetical protein